ncbi:MAG: SAM-dependent DNA methyltransferase, partial [Chloroherpetonaceae bacterium]
GYQDLYQLGLKNDLKHNLSKMIYIIPSNFLFGYTSSNKIKYDFFKYYSINKAVIFEKEIFEYTGTNVAICFFERKQ